MEPTVVEHLRVRPRIKDLNKYAQKVNNVAICSIAPIYAENKELEAFNICVEGPLRYVSHFARLITNADLKVS
jgi:hypothetical protein